MKKLRIIFTLALSIAAFAAMAQKTLTSVAKIKGVNSIYIGQAMLQMGASMADDFSGSDALNIASFANDLTSIEIINCENPALMEQVEATASEVLSAYPFEVFSEVQDDEDLVEISGVINDDGQIVSMLLIKSLEPDELSYILLKGNISLEKLQSSLNN